MKKILLTLIVMVAALTASAATTRTYVVQDGLSFLIVKYDSGSVYVYCEGYAAKDGISGGYGLGATSVTIPGFIDVDDVMRPVRIDSNAFKGHASLVSVTIKYGCIQIGGDAFSNISTLRSLIIPSSVTSINGAIIRQSGVSRATLDCAVGGNPTLTTSSSTAFQDSYYGKRVLHCMTYADMQAKKQATGYKEYFAEFRANPAYGPDFADGETYYKVTTPSTSGYAGELQLVGSLDESITINGWTTYLDDYCQSLPHGYQIKSVAADASKCLGAWNSLKTFSFTGNNAVTIGDNAFTGCTTLTSVTTSARTIGEAAFKGCTALSTLSLLSGVSTVKNEAFASTAVTEFTLPATLSSFNPRALVGSKLAYYYVADGNETYQAYLGLLYTREISPTLVSCPRKYFDRNHPLSRPYYTFLKGMGVVGPYAFEGCAPDADYRVFIPWGTYLIGENAFANSELDVIWIPSSVEQIAEGAFAGCTSLNDLYVACAKPLTVTSTTFTDVPTSCKLHVPAGYYGMGMADGKGQEAYRYANVWKNFKVITGDAYDYEAYDYSVNGGGIRYLLQSDNEAKVAGLNDNEYNATDTIYVPEAIKCFGNTFKVTSVGQRAFYAQKKITYINFPNTITTFDGADVNLSGGTYMDGAQFKDCTALTGVKLPRDLAKLPQNAFDGTTSLKRMQLPYGMTHIGGYAFARSGIEQLFIPSSITKIHFSFIDQCASLEKLYLNKFVSMSGHSDALTNAGINPVMQVYVPMGAVEQFKADTNGWSAIANRIQAGAYDFSDDLLTFATVIEPCKMNGNTVEQRGKVKYVYCPNQSTIVNAVINLYDNVLDPWQRDYDYTEIEAGAFKDQSRNVTFTVNSDHAAVERNYALPDSAFKNVPNLTSFPFADAPWTSIGESTFAGTGLEGTVDLGNTISSIGEHAFSGCADMTELFIPLGCSMNKDIFDKPAEGSPFKCYVDFRDHSRLTGSGVTGWLYSPLPYIRPYLSRGTATGSDIKLQTTIACFRDIVLPDDLGLSFYRVINYNSVDNQFVLKDFGRNTLVSGSGALVRGIEPGKRYRFDYAASAPYDLDVNRLSGVVSEAGNTFLPGFDYYTPDMFSDDFLLVNNEGNINLLVSGQAYVNLKEEDSPHTDLIGTVMSGEPTYHPYDVNQDTHVNIGDVNIILQEILAHPDGDGDSRYDVSGDGSVNVGDVNQLLTYIIEHPDA